MVTCICQVLQLFQLYDCRECGLRDSSDAKLTVVKFVCEFVEFVSLFDVSVWVELDVLDDEEDEYDSDGLDGLGL